MHELDEAAWERWVAFRKAIRKPIKPASEAAMKLKLAANPIPIDFKETGLKGFQEVAFTTAYAYLIK